MKPSEFFETYSLHDAPVLQVLYSPVEKRVIMQIELLNYDQVGYQEGDPEIISGELVFSQVDDVKSIPSLENLILSERARGSIVSCGHVPERDDKGLQSVEFVGDWRNYETHLHDVLIVSFLTADVEWRPFADRASPLPHTGD